LQTLPPSGVYLVAAAGSATGASAPFVGVFAYLATINAILAAFNMVPAFPLDGGRVLRAALWAWKGELRWATRITASIGSGFGILLIALGALSVLRGNFIGGMWWFLIGCSCAAPRRCRTSRSWCVRGCRACRCGAS
jgi:Zn-dependent protease